jgi:hypothetical protein
LSAQQQLALSGVIGETHTTNDITTADVATIRITDGYVIVDSTISAGDRIDFRADAVMIAPNGVVKTVNIGGEVDLRATGLFLMGAATPGTSPALIQSDIFVHVMGADLSLDGLIVSKIPTDAVWLDAPRREADAERRATLPVGILINATNEAIFYGAVTATGSLAVHAGVGANWTDAQLFGPVTIADLHGGNITINGGLLSSDGTAEIIAGGNVEVIGSTTVGSDLVTVQRPVINTTTKFIDVVTGTRQVAVGTVLVPQVTFVTTTSTQQVGTESVRVGSSFNTAEISLLQLGYYNATTGVTRKTFIEGVDYTNAGLTDTEWARSYDEATGDIINVGSVRPIGNTDFQQLTDEQRNAVLIKLGFRPLYNMSLADLAVHRTINGIPTTDAWHPSWEGQYTTQVLDTTYEFAGGSDPAGVVTYQQYANRSVVRLAMDGLRDKYVIIPTGADADFLKVVSKPGTRGVTEDVGEYYDQANVLYTQDKSAHLAVPEANDHRESDFDDSPIRWDISYHDSGTRWYLINDGRTGANKVGEFQYPLWAQGGKNTANDINGRFIFVQAGYTNTTRLINNQRFAGSHVVYSGDTEDLLFTYTFSAGVTYAIAGGGLAALWGLSVSAAGHSNTHTETVGGDATSLSGSWSDSNFLTITDVPRHTSFSASGKFATLIPATTYIDFSVNQDIYLSAIDQVSSGGNVKYFVNIAANSKWVDTGDINETFQDDFFNWESTFSDLKMLRKELFFQLVTQPTDIYDLRPKFETGTSETKVVTEKSVTQWQAQQIIGQQAVQTTERQFVNGPSVQQGSFDSPSLTATSTVTIAAGQDIAIRGIVQSTGNEETVSLTAGRDAIINGLVPEGAAPGTLPAVAQLLSDGTIKINAGRDALLGPSSNVQVDADEVLDTLSQINITSGRDAHIGGTVTTLNAITVNAAGDIALSGAITATHLIEGHAGTDGTGSITGDINTELTTFGSQIILTSGSTAGGITLTDSTLTSSMSTGFISLSALGGAISQTGGTASGHQLKARAQTGISTNTVVIELDAQNFGTGNVKLLNNGDLKTVGTLTNTDGNIEVIAVGTLTVGAMNGSNAITLHSSSDLSQSSGTTIGGGQLTIVAPNSADPGSPAFTLNTAVSTLVLTTHSTGDVVIHNSGTAPLELFLVVTNGSLSVDTQGDLIVTQAVSLTNSDSNDISLQADGNIAIGNLNAGVFAGTEAEARAIRLSYLSAALRAAGVLSTNAADLTEASYAALDQAAARTALIDWLSSTDYLGDPDAATKAAAEADQQLNLQQPLHAYGDIALNAGGSITEAGPADSNVDLVADSITIVSGNGVSGVDTAFNTVGSLHNTTGNVDLTDADSIGDPAPGLVIVLLTNDDGSVTVNVPSDLDVYQLAANGNASDVELNSGGIFNLLPVTGVPNTVNAGRNLSLHSKGTLYLNSGFTAPQSVSFTSDADVKISGATFTLSTVDPIFIHSDSSIRFNGTLESEHGITLISEHGDVSVNGNIRGRNGHDLESLTVIARGNLMTSGEFEGLFRFQSLLNDQTYYADTPELDPTSHVIDANGAPVASIEFLDLVPFTTTSAAIVKDPASGLDVFRDTLTERHYFRHVGAHGDEFSERTDPVTNLYPFSAYNDVTRSFVLIYSTTDDPTTGTLFKDDQTTPTLLSELSLFERVFVTVTDPAIIERLLPLTLKDLSGGQATGASIGLSEATIGNVTNFITLLAHGQVNATNLHVTSPTGTLTVHAADDLTTGNWNAHSIAATVTGFVDADGAIVTGSATIPLTLVVQENQAAVPVTMTGHDLRLTTRDDIQISKAPSHFFSLDLNAGDSFIEIPVMTVSGAGSSIALTSTADLSLIPHLTHEGVVPSDLNSNGPITLTSLGVLDANNVRVGGTVLVNSAINAGSGTLTINTNDTDSELIGLLHTTGGLTLSGGGTLTIPGNQNYSGTTTLTDSVMLLNGSTTGSSFVVQPGSMLTLDGSINSGGVTVQDGAVLNGTGRIGGALIAQSGGEVTPGHSPGKFTVDGNYTQQGGSALTLEINGLVAGTEFDQIEVTGSNRVVTLTGAKLVVTTDANIPDGTKFTIINNVASNSTVIGEFDGLPEGAFADGGTVAYRISYHGGIDGNDVVLTANSLDYGDAPNAAQSGFTNTYPASAADDGARHKVIGPRLGARVSAEANGANSVGALGDDTNGTFDDEDGILSVSTLIRSATVSTIASITVDLETPDATSNKLDAWIDFNRDGDWDDIGEQILSSADLGTTAGAVVLNFTIPAGSSVGDTYARFRISTAGGLTPRGLAQNGEVEDHAVTLIAAGQDTTVAPPTGGGAIMVELVGSNIVITQDGIVLQQIPVAGAGPIHVQGTSNTDDLFIVDYSNGNPIPAGGIFFDGDEGTGDNDKLRVIGNGNAAIYSPDAHVPGQGIVQVGSNLIHFTNLEPVDIFGMAQTTVTLPNGDDVITISNGFDLTVNGIIPAVIFSGTSGGVVFETLAVWNTTTIVLDTSLNADGNDSITLAGFSNAHGITNFEIKTGTGTDSLMVTGDLTLPGTFNASVHGPISQSGSSALTITGTTTINSGSASVSLTSTKNDFVGAVALTGGDIAIVDKNDMQLASISGTQATVTTGGALTLTGTINAGSGTVTLDVNQEYVLSAADNFTMQPGSSIVTTNDTDAAVVINVNSLLGGSGSAILQTITTGTSNGRVTIDSYLGAITDGNTTGNNITSGNALLRAVAGVGSSNDPIETTVNGLAGVGGSTGFFIVNSQALTIAQIGLMSGIATTTGDIDVRANGSIVIAQNVTSSGTGNVLLKANETASSDNLTLNAGVTINSTGGSVTIAAGDDITLTSTSHVSAGKDITITADSGDNDVGGALLTIAAELDSGAGTTISSGNDNDTFVITYPDLPVTNSGKITVTDQGGSDAVIINGTASADELSIKTTATNTTVTRGGNPGAEDISFTGSIETLRVNGLGGNDVIHVQPSILQSITVDGGLPGYGDAGTPPGNTLDLDPFGNTFTLVAPSIQVAGGAPSAFKPITVIGIQNLPITPLSPLSPSLKFDLNQQFTGGIDSATQAGFTGVAPNTVYNPAAAGTPGSIGTFGWSTPAAGFIYRPTTTGTLANLTDDGHRFVLTNTFNAKVPNGYVLVTVNYGAWNFENTSFQILNSDNNQLLANNLSTAQGEVKTASFVTLVQDGSLNLKFLDPTPDNSLIGVHSIEIVPAVLLTMGFNVNGTLTADGTTVDTFTIFNAPADGFVTITPSAGTLVGTDASTRFKGFQVATNSLGQGTFQLRRPSGALTAAVELTTPTGEAYSSIAIDYGSVIARNFDFNAPNSTTFSPFEASTNPNGYIGVVQSDLFTTARGYGWLTEPDSHLLPTISGLPTPDLLRDSHRGTAPGTFRVALPDGTYSVHATIGGVGDHKSLSVVANGLPVISGVAAKNYGFIESTFNVAVSGGLLDLTFSQNDGHFYDGHWTVSALEILPMGSVLPITPSNNPGSVEANGSTLTTITASVPGAADGTLITVSSTVGTITTPDVNPYYVGTQVAVSGGAISFTLKAPTKSGTPSIDLHSVNGLYHSTIFSSAFFDYVIPTTRRLDFNKGMTGSQSPTAAGFISVLTDAIPATNSFGWTDSLTNSFNNRVAPGKTTTALYQDGHRGATNESVQTFNVEAKPGQAYDVRVYLDRVGADGLAYDQLHVSVEGAGLQSVATTAGLYTTLFFDNASDLNHDGYIGLSIDDLGGTRNGWGINGLDLFADGSADPGAAPLLAASVGSDTSAAKLTEADAQAALDTVVQLLAQTGLSVEEVTRLRTVSIAIADLNALSALGVTISSSQIVLDDDAAGYGWSTNQTTPASDRYDLLSVLAHELEHSLGVDHADAGLMSPVLQLGQRTLDDAFSDANLDWLLP